ncbi:MAG: flagellar basal body-associated FliL family protein [Spirochaetaceae bacterium]|jgi:flagellar FliL protein|nr:flagellar basal body-associated FliL family protein [Spirochaetaceae bacterium]
MGDDDGLDLGGDDVTGVDSGGKKSGGLSGLLPNLLKFVAIGLGALIFIVTVAVITFNILSGRGESQTVIDPTSEYIGTRPQFSTFTLIGQLSTRTRDQTHTVVVDMLLEYDLNNNAAATELTSRVNQLRDFTRNYFSTKYYTELEPENEVKLKQEIREILNTRYLDTAKIRGVLFNKLDLMEI